MKEKNHTEKGLSKKESRELQVLMGLIELYLETGKPVGSNTLREHGFQTLSPATIRNYFVELERQGYLKQSHTSGGRIPTNEGYRLYAQEALSSPILTVEDEEKLTSLSEDTTRNLLSFLQNAAEKLSEVTGLASFLSSVRFDHDLVLDIKLVPIDHERLLCVIITDFGQILTETLHHKEKLSSFSLKRIEAHIQWRLRGGLKPLSLSIEEETFSQALYNEIMVRYLVRYSNFSDEDIYRTGFSRLLGFPEFNDPVALTTGLSLFENTSCMRLLLNECTRSSQLNTWIGSDLAPYLTEPKGCAVIAAPYHIGGTAVGAVGLLGPCRIPYRTLFGAVQFFSDCISKSLTKSLFKFKISFRQPRSEATPYIQNEERAFIDQTTQKLLERKERP